jgi:hypothetical protein
MEQPDGTRLLTEHAGYFDDNLKGGSGANTVGGDVDPESTTCHGTKR